MKIKLLLLFLLILFIQNYSISQVATSNKNLKVQKHSDKVCVFEETERYRVNLVVITGTSGIILLDTGFKLFANDLVDSLKTFNSGRVEYIINSHIDRDHVEANYIFGKDVTIIGHKNCVNFFNKSGPKSVTFDDNYSFKFNNLDINCTAYPGGHTPCDIIVYIPKLNIAYLGDIYLQQQQTLWRV